MRTYTLKFAFLAALLVLGASTMPAAAGKPASARARGRDSTPPTVVCPADILTEATSPLGAVVTFSATASDDVDPSPTLTYDPASGSRFPLGTTTVTVVATDWRGNSSTCTFAVTVHDTTAPYCPPDMTVEATGPGGAAVTFAFRDLVDPSPTVISSPESGSTLPIGTTTVTATATDWAGNSTTCSFDVTVRDTTSPWVWAPHDILVRADGEDGAVVRYSATALDQVDPEPVVTFDPPSGSTFPIGTTTVTVTATDDHGNTASDAFQVTVLPFDDDPTDSPFAGTYSWLWTVGTTPYESLWYAWIVTIAGDGTVSGTGEQVSVLVPVYSEKADPTVSTYSLEALPDGVTPTGELSGLVSDGGILQVDGQYEEYDFLFGIFTLDLVLQGQASLDDQGNLVLTDTVSGEVTVWYRD